MAIEYLIRPKSPGTDQIPAELVTAGVKKFTLRSINSIIRFRIRRNCLRCERSRSWYLCIRRAIKHVVVIIEAYHFCQLRSNFIQHPAVKVNPICRRNYLGSSMWISRQQVKYWLYEYILHLSHTWEEMGIKQSSASALYRLQDNT
jgi:hypothetical protein